MENGLQVVDGRGKLRIQCFEEVPFTEPNKNQQESKYQHVDKKINFLDMA